MMVTMLLLLSIVWVGIFAIARLVAPTSVSALGATAFMGFLGGQVASGDYGLWWGDILMTLSGLALLGFLALTVRPRLRG